jgi:hypothetical protein
MAEGLADETAIPRPLFGEDQLAVTGEAEAVFLAVMFKDHLAVSPKKLGGPNPRRLTTAGLRRLKLCLCAGQAPFSLTCCSLKARELSICK